MSPGEQSFVQLERETCEARLEAFVKESGEKECTKMDLRKKRERGLRWTERVAKEMEKEGKEKGRKEGKEERRKEGQSLAKTTKYLSIARAGRTFAATKSI